MKVSHRQCSQAFGALLLFNRWHLLGIESFALSLNRRRGPRPDRAGTSTRRLDQSDGCGSLEEPAMRKAKPPKRRCRITTYIHYRLAHNPADSWFEALRNGAAQHVGHLRFVASGSQSGTGNSRKGKTLKSPPIGHFPEFSRRAPFTSKTVIGTKRFYWNDRQPMTFTHSSVLLCG